MEPHKGAFIRLNGDRKRAIENITTNWLKDRHMEMAGATEWLSSAFPVQKKTPGEWRGVIDYRGVNLLVETDVFPLPRIGDILERQGRRHIWSIIDLKDAFSQVPLTEESRNILAIQTPLGVVRPRMMPQGYKNSPSVWQRMIEWCMKDIRDIADPYIDDVLIGTERKDGMTEEELIDAHMNDIRKVLNCLAEHKLVADLKKTTLFCKVVEFCGHKLSEGQRQPSPGKMMALEKWPLPTTISTLRGFLGFCNYYSEYVPDYASYAAPLQEMLKVDKVSGRKGSKTPVHYGPLEKKAFQDLRSVLLKNLLLQNVDPDKPYVLCVDASGSTIGGSVNQLIDTNRMPTKEDVLSKKVKPVAFFSKKLTPGQRDKWCIHEKEMYAIIMMLRKYAGWVGSQPVLVVTDHSSLTKWMTEVLATPTGPTGRQARWHQLMAHFDVYVEYITGTQNLVADAMTRLAYPAGGGFKDDSKHGGHEETVQVHKDEVQYRMEERACRILIIQDDEGTQMLIRASVGKTGMEVWPQV